MVRALGAAGAPRLWTARVDSETADGLARMVRRLPPADVAHYMGYLHEGSSLDDCEYVLKFLESSFRTGDKGVLLYAELAVRFLSDWGERHREKAGPESWKYIPLALVAQHISLFSQETLQEALKLTPLAEAVAEHSGNERFKALIGIQRLYLRLFLGYLPAGDMGSLPEEVEAMRRFNDDALHTLLPALEGILAFIRGDFQKTIACYRRSYERPYWWYSLLFEGLELNTLFAANYLHLYHFAVGISESTQRSKELSGETAVAQFYLAQFCFLLLRKGDTEKALEGLNRLFLSPLYAVNYILNALCSRALALHHYIEGRVSTAHRLFDRETRRALEKGFRHGPFYDPLVLDMLYVFEREGCPPVPGYELDPLLTALLGNAGAHLKGAALRVHALREGVRGAPPEKVLELLYKSFMTLIPTADSRELALTEYALADAFDAAGQHDQAERLRGALSKGTGHGFDATTDYRLASVWCLNASESIREHATRNRFIRASFLSPSPQRSREILSRCHTAFHALPVHESVNGMFYALVKIAQNELDAERVALFSTDDAGAIRCESAVNLTRIELASEAMRPCLAWLREWTREGYCSSWAHQMYGMCLRLDVGQDRPWLLYLDNTWTKGMSSQLGHFEMQEIARLFAAELRSCLRLQMVKDREVRAQCERFQSIASQKDKNECVVLGDGLWTLLRQARQAAATDVPILLWGETGVGKEIMARQIHEASGRAGPFIAVHPASMPESLFESEFFGYERGAFTGAVRQKIGLFEISDEGTLFIDEIGEMSQLVQTKLLRVLQEHRFMRVGGTREIVSRFRLIAATNRDLWKEVREGRFRQDLLYRISVLPLLIPPLRERPQDILPLAVAFIEHFSRRHRKRPLPLNEKQQRALCAYAWPGNVRELRNVIERAIILCQDEAPLDLDFSRDTTKEPLPRSGTPDLFSDLPTLPQLEERYLTYVLGLAKGRVRGDGGAARLLDIKVTTLYAKLRKYGILGRG